MTSPYDPIVNPGTGVDLNPGTGTQTSRPVKFIADDRDETGVTAYWSYYANLYKYYSVLGCRYRIRVENLSHDKFFLHKMWVNNDYPNVRASNWDMKLWRGVDSRLLTPMMRFANKHQVFEKENYDYNVENEDDNMNAPSSTNATEAETFQPVSNPSGSSTQYFVGEYRPGQYQREVQLDDDVEIWTAVNANPKLPELLFLRARAYDNTTPATPGDAWNQNREISFNITVECEYLVEFKELSDEFYRPASRNPITVVAQPNDQDDI